MDVTTAAHLVQGLMTKKGIAADNYLARGIGNIIFDISITKSGYVSKSLVDEYGFRSSSFCPDHFHSRQQVGIRIVKENPSFDKIIEILTEASMVHLVTSEENIRLSPIQNGKDTREKSWQDQYILAGIDLVRDKGTAPVYFYNVYSIDGVEYSNIQLASQATGLSWDVIRKRCSSQARKWNNYSRKIVN